MNRAARFLWLPGLALALVSPASHAGDPNEGFYVRPAEIATRHGRTVPLKIVHCQSQPSADRVFPTGSDSTGGEQYCEGDAGYAATDTSPKGDDLAPLYSPTNVKWQLVSGPGRLQGAGMKATYYAPDSGPVPAEATVTVSFNYSVGNKKIIDYSHIHIVDQPEVYRGTARFHSAVANTTAVAHLTWTRIHQPDADEDEAPKYRATGSIQGSVSVPDCKTVQVKLPVTESDDGEMSFDPERKTYLFNFSSDTGFTIRCGSSGSPSLMYGSSVFHFGNVCGSSTIRKGPGGMPYMDTAGTPIADVLLLQGTDVCKTAGMFGTTTWKFHAIK